MSKYYFLGKKSGKIGRKYNGFGVLFLDTFYNVDYLLEYDTLVCGCGIEIPFHKFEEHSGMMAQTFIWNYLFEELTKKNCECYKAYRKRIDAWHLQKNKCK